MRILIDITHPAYLHFFRFAIKKLESEGHSLCLTGRDKDILRDLAKEYGLNIKYFGGDPKGMLGKSILLARRKIWLAHVIREFRPDILVACAGPFIAVLGKILRIPTLVFYDTENDTFSNLFTYPFATRICIPDCYLDQNISRSVRYAGYHSLAYLHPNQFTPDPKIKEELGVQPNERYAIVRFVGWRAGHDIGIKGLSIEQKINAVQALSKFGKVFISEEGKLPEELEKFRFPLPHSKMHDAIAFATLVLGESSTMCSEAAVLGVPSVFIYPRIKRGYTKEQSEKWKIVHWYTVSEFREALVMAVEVIKENNSFSWKRRGQEIVDSSISLTEFIKKQILDYDLNTD